MFGNVLTNCPAKRQHRSSLLDRSSTQDFSYLVQKQKWFILAGLVLAVLFFALYVLYFFVPLYSSSAKVLIRNIPQSPVVTSFGEDSLVKSESGYSNPLFNYMQILQSNRLARSVYGPLRTKYAKDFDMLGIKNQTDWVEKYSKLMMAKVEPSTDVIKINLKWNDEEHAAEVLDHILKAFRATNLDIRQSSQRKRSKYIDEQLRKVSRELDMVRQQIKHYRLANRTIDLESEAMELTKARIDLLKQNELLKAQAQFDETRKTNLAKQLGYKSGDVALKATGIGGDPYLVQLSQALATAEQRYAKLSAKMTDDHPDVQEARNEINSLRGNIRNREYKIVKNAKLPRGAYDETSRAVAADLVRAQADHIAHRSELRMIENGINSLVQRENTIPGKKQGLDELTKKEQSLAAAYDSTLQKDLETKIKENQIDDNIVILDSPTKGDFVQNDALLKAILMLFFGVFGGFAIGWLKDFIEDRWQDAEEIETLTGQTVLGSIPWLSKKRYQPGILTEPPSSELGIAYAQVANQLLLSSYRDDAQVIALVASKIGRTDSRVAYNLCATLSRLGKSVVFINTLHNQNRQLTLQTSNLDLVDVVTEFNAAIRKHVTLEQDTINDLLHQSLRTVDLYETADDVDNNLLVSLNIDKMNIHLHDVVGSKGFELLLSELKHRYEFIIIDTPDTTVQDPAIQSLVIAADATVIITNREASRKGLQRLVKYLKRNDQKILGIITRFKTL
jgi:polysaccharide biosynthesis transport protein